VESRGIDPEPGEQPIADWEWLDPEDLRDRADELEADVVEVGQRAIEAVDS
jgi:hypothetical protein